MKKLIFVLVVAILLAGSAVVTISVPSYAQGYGGYNYPPPPQNMYATPWVGNNTPWTFYQGDWFLNGLLYQFFGNQYGWAPYYAYPPTYIVRPKDWYAPRWNAWYQRNPHYWQNFEQKYPYWRGHRAGQHYDQNFYNQHHRGQGSGWNQGFHGARPAGATGPGGHTPGATGPGGRTPGAPAPGVFGPGASGPGFHGPGTTGPGVRSPQATGPGVHPSGVTGPGVRPHGTTGPGQHPAAVGPGQHPGAAGPGQPARATGPGQHPGATGPGQHPQAAGHGQPARATGPGQHPGAAGPGGQKPEKTRHDEEKK